MTWPATPKPLAAVAAALILTTAGVAVQGRQPPAPEAPREQAKTTPPPTAGVGSKALLDIAANQALAREQLALIDQALATLAKLAQNARVELDDPRFSLWEHRRLETLRKTGAGKAEIVAAIEKLVEGLKKQEAFAKQMHQAARATEVPVYDVQFRRMEAEMRLNEEKAR